MSTRSSSFKVKKIIFCRMILRKRSGAIDVHHQLLSHTNSILEKHWANFSIDTATSTFLKIRFSIHRKTKEPKKKKKKNDWLSNVWLYVCVCMWVLCVWWEVFILFKIYRSHIEFALTKTKKLGAAIYFMENSTPFREIFFWKLGQ